MGIGFLGIGFQPKWGIKDIPVMPKVALFFQPLFKFLEMLNSY